MCSLVIPLMLNYHSTIMSLQSQSIKNTHIFVVLYVILYFVVSVPPSLCRIYAIHIYIYIGRCLLFYLYISVGRCHTITYHTSQSVYLFVLSLVLSFSLHLFVSLFCIRGPSPYSFVFFRFVSPLSQSLQSLACCVFSVKCFSLEGVC